MPPEAPLRVAVVGAGYFGRFHYDAWSRLPEARLVGLCVRQPAHAEAVAAEFGAPGEPLPVYGDLEQMVEALRPDLVDITAPPEAHLRAIETLAPRVGHIICQKPFCGDLASARKAVALARQAGCRLAVHENIRFQPWYRAAKAVIESGTLGEIYQASFRLRPGDGQGPAAYLSRQPYFQRMPRFLVHETAVHWIDCFRFLLGEPSGLFARLTRLNPAIAGEDAGIILFDVAGGRRALFDGNRLADHAAQDRRRTLGELLVEGSLGNLRLDGEARLWLRRFGEAAERPVPFDWQDRAFGGDCVYLCNRHILAAWRAGRDCETEAAAYLRNQEIEEAVYKSAASGRYITL